GQRIGKSSWLRELENISLSHGVSLLRWRSGGLEHPHDTPPYPFTPSPTFAHSSGTAPQISKLRDERVEHQQPARKLVLHSNHQHLVSPESANGCTERPTHERVEAARAFGVGSGLRSNRRQNALGCLWLTEYTNQCSSWGSEQRHRCRRVALRISRTVFSALSGMRLFACLIVAPQRGYDEPAILSYAISSFCPTSADGLQDGSYSTAHRWSSQLRCRMLWRPICDGSTPVRLRCGSMWKGASGGALAQLARGVASIQFLMSSRG